MKQEKTEKLSRFFQKAAGAGYLGLLLSFMAVPPIAAYQRDTKAHHKKPCEPKLDQFKINNAKDSLISVH